MTGILILVLHGLFLAWIGRNILFLTHLWQLKEYRFDRFLVHLKETKQGRDLLLSFGNIAKLILIATYPLTIALRSFEAIYPFVVIVVFLLDFLKVLKEVKERTLKIPALTVKAFTIAAISSGFVFILFSIPLTNIFLWALIIDRVLPFLIAYLTFFASIPTEFYYDRTIAKAMQKLSRNKKITVIGITGSYGKSSTKEFVAQVLQNKFSVIKTIGTNNTPIGIAQTILKYLKPYTQIFVVEMGAYKRGEIAELCNIVKPKIAILTAVNNQHISLFGSLSDTMAGKYELIESLPKSGIAIFNGSNENARILYEQTKKRRFFYYVGDSKKIHAEIRATNIVVHQECVEFDVLLDGRKVRFKANLLGRHNVENLLPAILIAKRFGMTFKEIKEAVLKIQPLPMTTRPIKMKNGVVFIDDTFNANASSLKSASNYMKVYKGRRILVFHPIIELGREAERVHYTIGKESAKIFDYIFLTNSNFSQSFIKGAKEEGLEKGIWVLTPKEIREYLPQLLKRDTVVLFEGKEAGNVLKRMEEND